MSFEKKVIIITGAGSGIGAATAVHFAGLGAHLALVDRNGETLQVTKTKCIAAAEKFSQYIVEPLAIVCDITTDAKTVFDETIKTFAKLDVLVNNAGICCKKDSIESESIMENYDAVMSINLKSVVHLTSLAVPYLTETKGNIVNVSSAAGLISLTNLLIYSLSKAAVNQLTKCVALELAAKGVRVNAVNPGAIYTNIQRNSGMDEESFQKAMAMAELFHPLGRIGDPKEVAIAIAFLASDKASFITGTLLPVDGGRAIASQKNQQI